MSLRRNQYPVLLTLIIVLLLSILPGQVSAKENNNDPQKFAALLSTDQEGVIGVVAAGDFSFPVVQQESSGSVTVSKAKNTVTQFGMATELGNIGLLAHNYLAGKAFFDLEVGQRVYVVFKTGRVEAFTVTRILKYQALTPHSPYSDFREVGGDTVIPAAEMFYKAYGGSYHVTFQTCIKQNGDNSWGRLFVIAEPVVSPS